MTPRFFCMMSDVSSRQKFCKCPHRRYRISHIGKSLFLLPPLFSRFPSVLTKPSLQPAFPPPLPFPSLGHSKHHTGREERGEEGGKKAFSQMPRMAGRLLPLSPSPFSTVFLRKKKILCSQVMLLYLVVQRTN